MVSNISRKINNTSQRNKRNNQKRIKLEKKRTELLEKKIIKAKEIIKNLMLFAEMDNREYEKEYKEAEQFLKEK